MPNPETPHQPRTRQRTPLSCTECRKRKQKCNQAKDRPCNHCARRYPPVECVYEKDSQRSESRSRERLVGSSSQSHDREEAFQPAADLRHRTPLPIRSPLNPGPWYAEELPPNTSDSRRPSSNEIRELSPASRERLQTHPGTSYDISRIFLVDYPRPESYGFSQLDAVRYVTNLGPTQFGGSFIDSLNHLPMDVTRRNAELLHFFVQRLSPFISSIDGTNPSPEFTSQWITFMIKSPLVVYLSILSAAYFQATARRIDVEKSVDAMTIRTRLIVLINEHIGQRGRDGRGVSDEAIAAVMSLSYNELIYSDKKSVLAHMSGLRSMIRARGGIEKIPVSVLRKMVAQTDYQVACTYEIETFLHAPRSSALPTLGPYPIDLDCPFLPSRMRFSDSIAALDITLETAQLLDDMRFLTTSILSLSHSHSSASAASKDEEQTAKFLKTVQWIHNRLSSSSPTSPTANSTDYLYQTVHTTALIYTTAILLRTPLSRACTSAMLQKLWSTMWRVPLPRWKRIPGVFLWVLLVVNPFVRDKPEGRFVKGLLAAGIIGVGVVRWEVVVAILRGVLRVEWWLGGGGEVEGDEGVGEGVGVEEGVGVVEEVDEMRVEGEDPDWAFKEAE